MSPAKKYLLLIFILIAAISCENKQLISNAFHEEAEEIQRIYTPDLSLNVFEAQLLFEDGDWILRGETTVPKAYHVIEIKADSLLGKGNYKNEFVLLPDSSLGDSSYAIVRVSVAHLREEPRHAAQLIDQRILGSTLQLLKNKGGWYLVQTEYGYIGWMRWESFYRSDKEGINNWNESPKVIVTQLFTIIYSQPDENSEPVCDAVLNALFRLEGKSGKWLRVSAPDGRVGFIKKQLVSTNVNPDFAKDKSTSEILMTARSMMGIPYLWGGNSSKGNDCSGFTQTVFKANGLQLQRDARQQALEGEEIIPEDDFSNVLPGDLLFFGAKERITHVGISMGGAEFIHQSGDVHINSLDSTAYNYSPYRKKTLRMIKRIL
jgi:hypothetical protein